MESKVNIWQNPLVIMGALAAALIIVFLLGLIPMWLTASERANRLAETQRELKVAQLQNTLSSAVIYARRGDYEPARQSASDFFTTLRQQLDAKGDQSFLAQAPREGLMPLLSRRDDIITLLARNDPAAADRLSDIYVSFRKVLDNVQQAGGS